MALLKLILIILAVVCFILHAVGVATPKVNLLGIGLACFAASFAVTWLGG
jgi:hypothetical protein